MLCPKTLVALALAAVIAVSTFATQAVAQATEEDWQLLNRILEASNSVSPETAREAHKACVAIGEEVAARTNLHPAERLYFESEVESCIAYAMNNGQFSDEPETSAITTSGLPSWCGMRSSPR